MQFIDTHIHLQDFPADFAPSVLANSKAKKLVLVSVGQEDFAKIAALKDKFPQLITPAFGFHPWQAKDENLMEQLEFYLQKYSDALVGEIGVDELKEPVNDKQRKLFSAQLELAKKYHRPVIVHAAKAFVALQEFEPELRTIKYVHHGYVKNHELLKFIKKTGGYIGLGALFLKQEKASELWQMMPMDKTLFETDAPYRVMAEDYNMKIEENMQKLADIAGQSCDNLAKQLIRNAEDFIKC